MSHGQGLLFQQTTKKTISVFTDADWAGSITDRRSTSGHCIFVWGNLVTWRSKKQSVVALRSAKAEVRALALGICEGTWLKKIITELGFQDPQSINTLCDNQSAISIAKNTVQHDITKHDEIDRHFIKKKIESGLISLNFVSTSHQIADILTMVVPRKLFDELKSKLGMFDIYNLA